MTDNPNKKTIWDKIHLDPTFMLIILALLTYSALVIWSASGQDLGMTERKIGQIMMGLVVMIVMAQIPPRVYEGWAPYLYIICIILLVAVDAFGAISKGAQRWLDLGVVRFQPSEIAKIAVPLMVARFINRDVCPPSLKNTAIALVLIFMPTLLVAAQPDLGTAILVALSGLFVLFLSGLSWRLILIAALLVAAFILFSLKLLLALADYAGKVGYTVPSRNWSFCPSVIPTLSSRYWRKNWAWWAY